MFEVEIYLSELSRRIDTIRRIVNAAHPQPPAFSDISREARGVAVLLLFASYENLLTGVCRGLLETAAKLRVGNRRLKTGLRLFAVFGGLQAIASASKVKIWKEGTKLLEQAALSTTCTVNANLFPEDGSFMKASQVRLFCDLFGLGDPALILQEVWGRLDTIVTQRNSIAHGKHTPEEVGRNYTLSELHDLIDLWEKRWSDFVNHVGQQASARDFFRSSR